MKRLVAAFRNSMAGLAWAARQETAVGQELLLLLVGAPLAWLLAPDAVGFLLMLGALLLLLAVELLNTAIEKLADVVMPERDSRIGVVKDLGSAAVFAMLVMNGLVWGYYLWRWLVL